MNRKLITGLLVAALGLFLVIWLASPLLAVRALIDAAERGDESKLERLVDFPVFRESVKDELNAELRREMREQLGERDSALAGLGMMLAPALVEGAVEAVITPSAIASMVRTAETPQATERGATPPPTAEDGDDIRQRYSYRGLNTFVVTLSDADRPDETLDLLMERRGVFAWKLAGVEFPDREPGR